MKKLLFLLLGILPFCVQAQNDTVANFDPTVFTCELDTIDVNITNDTVEVIFRLQGIDIVEWAVASQYGMTSFIPQSSLREDVNDFAYENFNYDANFQPLTDTTWISATTFVLSPGVTDLYIRIGYGFIAHVLDANENILYTDVTEYWCPNTYEVSLNPVITSISENEKSALGVFPNPATDFVTVKDDYSTTASITNTLGQTVRTIPTNQPVSIADLRKGVYFLNCKHKLLIE